MNEGKMEISNNMAQVRSALAGITGETITAPPPPTPRIQPIVSDWYVLSTEPNREMTAQANLVLRQIPFYMPTIYRAARLSARQHAAGADHPDITLPLFPRTLFITEKDLERNYHLIPTLPGMTSKPVMMFGEHFAMLRPEGMAAIRYIEAGERELYLRQKRRPQMPAYLPEIGEEVRVLLEEVMGGTCGTVCEVDDKGRITLLTEIMKRTVRVKVSANQIEPV